jgi:tetratricopeptide (TPR) repeat protein
VLGAAASTVLWLHAESSLGAEREARRLLQLSYGRLDSSNRELNRSNRELERARVLERDARLRGEERFRLALRAVQDTIEGPDDTSLLRLTDAPGSRQRVILRIIDLYKTLQASLEGDPTTEARVQLARSYIRLSRLTAEVGSADVARAAMNTAIEIRHELATREPENPARLLDEAATLAERGAIERQFNLNDAAMQSFQDARVLIESVVRRNPEDARAQDQLSWCLGNLGATQLGDRQPEESLRTQRSVLEIREGLMRRDPGNIMYRAGRAWCRLDVAHCYRNLGRFPEAIATFELARREFEAIHRERPDDASLTLWLVDFLNHLATVLVSDREFDRALSASEQACRLTEELALAHPKFQRYTLMLALNLHNHSSRLLAANLPAGAPLDRSAALYENLVKSYPGVYQYRLELLRVRVGQVQQARARGDRRAADEAARRAVDRCLPMTQEPTADESLNCAINCYLHLALTALDGHRRADAESALKTSESLLRQVETIDPTIQYNLACVLAQLSAQAKSAADRATLNDRAMTTLLQSVASGDGDNSSLRDDADLTPLRHRPEYQLLLLDLAFPTDPFSG